MAKSHVNYGLGKGGPIIIWSCSIAYIGAWLGANSQASLPLALKFVSMQAGGLEVHIKWKRLLDAIFRELFFFKKILSICFYICMDSRSHEEWEASILQGNRIDEGLILLLLLRNMRVKNLMWPYKINGGELSTEHLLLHAGGNWDWLWSGMPLNDRQELCQQ